MSNNAEGPMPELDTPHEIEETIGARLATAALEIGYRSYDAERESLENRFQTLRRYGDCRFYAGAEDLGVVEEATVLDDGAREFLSEVLQRSTAHGFRPFAVPLDLCVLLMVRVAPKEKGTIDGRFLHNIRWQIRLSLDELLPMYWGEGSAAPRPEPQRG